MLQPLIPMAICYDFDGTLSPGNMQEYGFVSKLGMTPADFWAKSNALAEATKADSILAYMRLMIEESKARDLPFQRTDFQSYGKTVPLFQGVSSWFERMNHYAATKGIALKHFIVSSGLKEMVEGTEIAPYFTEIFASTFMYDANGAAVWPAVALNYTSKTQFLYRINKGCLDINDNATINRFMADSDRPIPFKNMIYIGDGETDVPCMKMIKREGGHSIAVYEKDNDKAEENAKRLILEDRVNTAVSADYRADSEMDVFVKRAIDKVQAAVLVQRLEKASL